MAREPGRRSVRRIGAFATAILLPLVTLALEPRGAQAVGTRDVGAAAMQDIGGQGAVARAGVRPLGPDAVELVGQARLRSHTVQRLVKELEGSDVVVYVRLRLMPRCRTGRLTLLGAAAGLRYLKIEVAATPRTEEAIAWLGHELHHALEVASAAGVRDEASLEALYRRIGEPQIEPTSRYETDAAVSTGEKVLAEVRTSAKRRPVVTSR